MATRLYLLRHGLTTAAAGTFVGSSDLPLSGLGLERLESMTCLRDADDWYCSPMLRTRQTVDALQKKGYAITTIHYDERLREINFGRWEMKTFADISAIDPAAINDWNQYLDFIFPEGEAVNDFIVRVREMLGLFAAADNNSIAVVTHGGIIRTMICLALGISARNYLLFDVQPASLTILDLFSEGGVLNGLNL